MSCGSYKVENGIISKTHLGFEDHGFATFFLQIDFDGSGQGFGNYALDDPYCDPNAPDLKPWEVKDGGRFVRRRGTACGMDFILKIIKTLGVNKWEDLPGTNLRVRHCRSKIQAIGHIYKDRWLDVDEHRREWYGEN